MTMIRRLLLSSLLAVSGAYAQETYDYIVVGSGPGGAPVAVNLAKAGYSVLLLEAGDDQGSNPTYAEMANFNAAGNDPLSRWDFFVKHSEDEAREAKYEKSTWRKPDGSFYVGLDPPEGSERLGIYYPRAATLGGCAMHNGGICSLPADDDWDYIANITGDDSWRASNMRKYFVRMENNEYVPKGTEGHGYDGYVHTSIGDGSWIENPSDIQVLAEQLIDKTGGGSPTRDLNEDSPDRDTTTGVFGLATHGDSQGRRTGSNTVIRATLNDPAGYPLTVQTDSLVTRILFDDGDVPTALGVEFLRGKSMYKADPRFNESNAGEVGQALASREVIISAGAFNSPQLLKLSGIGPPDELEALGIELRRNVPGVGEGMGDNYEIGMLGLANRELTGPGGVVAVLLKTPTAGANRNIHAWCGSFSFEGFYPGFPTEYGPRQYECAIVHMNPKSQAGSVRLRTTDPRDMPEINFRFYENEGDRDLTEMLDAVKIFRSATHGAGEPITPWDELHPCPGINANCSDEVQKENIKLQSYSHHATSTCKIGPADDPWAVIDSRFRVHAVNNLRVVDASAFPKTPGAFPVCPTFMLGEKASDVILEDAAAAAAVA